MDLVFNENKIVTAVTLSRHQDIPIDEAYSSMKKFHEMHNDLDGLWATFNVTGSTTVYGVRANSTVLYRDTDLDKIRDAFNEIYTVELFSLQTVKIEDLRSLMTVVRLQDETFLRVNTNRAPVYSREVSLMARDLRDGIKVAKSDILLSMKSILFKHDNSHLSNIKLVDGEEKAHMEVTNVAVNDRFLESNDIFSANQSQISSAHSQQSLPNMDNLPQSSSSSEDSLSPKPCHDVTSKSDPEEVSIQPESEGKERPSDDKEMVSCKRKKVTNCDEVPVKKKQAERFVETYRDEDGFLVTKEVIRIVETIESASERESRSLRSVNLNKDTHPASKKKNSSHVSITPKISSFFPKKK